MTVSIGKVIYNGRLYDLKTRTHIGDSLVPLNEKSFDPSKSIDDEAAACCRAETGPLVDSFGRVARKLRISVTDRCNFKCSFCMPTHPVWLPHSEILSFEEIVRLARIFASMGIDKIRLSGGEPLVRKDIERLVHMLVRVEPVIVRFQAGVTVSVVATGCHRLRVPGSRSGWLMQSHSQEDSCIHVSMVSGLDKAWGTTD